MRARLRRPAVRAGLVVASVVAVLSVGGGFLAGVVLAPLLLVASRDVGPWPSRGFVLLAALLLAEVSWAVVYWSVSDHQPTIWLVPIAVGMCTAVVGWRTAGMGMPRLIRPEPMEQTRDDDVPA